MANKNGFFVRLCYGYVGSYKDTSTMTTKEVIDEFLKRKGVSNPKDFFNKYFKEISKIKLNLKFFRLVTRNLVKKQVDMRMNLTLTFLMKRIEKN